MDDGANWHDGDQAGSESLEKKPSKIMPRELVRIPRFKGMMVNGLIEDTPTIWKVDTGARRTFISEETYQQLYEKPSLQPVKIIYTAADGREIKCLGEAVMTLTFGNVDFEFLVTVGGVRFNLLGEDFISKFRCNWDHDDCTFVIQGSEDPGVRSNGGTSRVITYETVFIPAGSEAIIRCGLTNKRSKQEQCAKLGILSPDRGFIERYGLAIARTLVDADKNVVYARVLNPGHETVQVYKHSHIAVFSPVKHIGAVLDNTSENNVCEVDIGCSEVDDGIPEHLTQVFSDSSKGLTDEQQLRFKSFLMKWKDDFAKPGEVGRTDKCVHRIELNDDKPIRDPPRRIPLYKREALAEELKQLEDKGIIEKSESPWSSQIVMVQKHDGSWRMCVDYRKLNEKTIKDAYPIPRVDENLDALSGADWFSSLDLDMAYHQVPMEKVDREKTAFATQRGGLYQFVTMPFGLCNAASTFQRLMETVLGTLQCSVAVLYLDDIVVFGKTFEEHMVNLEKVLGKLHESGLLLKCTKCKFFRREATFLGH